MNVRINDFVEFVKDNIKYQGNVIEVKDDSFSINALINDKLERIDNLYECDMDKIISHTVLCYIDNGDSYLMLLRNKRKNDMNEGKWLGVGGHVNFKESLDEALIREVKEETNLNLFEYNNRGIVYFYNGNYLEVMHLYTSDSFSGELIECDEGTLKWIKKPEILNLNLWEGDRVFLPLLMENEPYFEIGLHYNKDNKLEKVERY